MVWCGDEPWVWQRKGGLYDEEVVLLVSIGQRRGSENRRQKNVELLEINSLISMVGTS